MDRKFIPELKMDFAKMCISGSTWNEMCLPPRQEIDGCILGTNRLRSTMICIAALVIVLMLTGCSTALSDAARTGNLAEVRKLLSSGANVNKRDSDEWTPLMVAVRYGTVEVVEEILERKPDVNAKNNYGLTALMIAARNSKWREAKDSHKVARMLIQAGADVEAKDNEGWSPLMYAARFGAEEVVSELIKRKADVNVISQSGWNALMFAALNRGGNFYADFGFIHSDSSKATDELLAAGADINAKTPVTKQTALFQAAIYGTPKIVSSLVSRKADVNAKDSAGWTPLLYATRNLEEHTMETVCETVKTLLNAGADVNMSTTDGVTPLMLALQHGDSKLVGLILEKGAEVNARSAQGLSPIMIAASYGSYEALTKLLARNVDVNVRDPNGATPLMLLASRELKYASASIERQGHAFIWTETSQGTNDQVWGAMASAMIAKGADPNATDSTGTTALMLAARNTPPDWAGLVSALLRHGADPTAQDQMGRYIFAKQDGAVAKMLTSARTSGAKVAVEPQQVVSVDWSIGKGRLETVPEWMANANFTTAKINQKWGNKTYLLCRVALGYLRNVDGIRIKNSAQTCLTGAIDTADWHQRVNVEGRKRYENEYDFLDSLSVNTNLACLQWENTDDVCDKLADKQTQLLLWSELRDK